MLTVLENDAAKKGKHARLQNTSSVKQLSKTASMVHTLYHPPGELLHLRYIHCTTLLGGSYTYSTCAVPPFWGGGGGGGSYIYGTCVVPAFCGGSYIYGTCAVPPFWGGSYIYGTYAVPPFWGALTSTVHTLYHPSEGLLHLRYIRCTTFLGGGCYIYGTYAVPPFWGAVTSTVHTLYHPSGGALTSMVHTLYHPSWGGGGGSYIYGTYTVPPFWGGSCIYGTYIVLSIAEGLKELQAYKNKEVGLSPPPYSSRGIYS